MAITDKNLAEMVSKQRWTEQVVAEAVAKNPDTFASRFAQDAISLSRENLESVIAHQIQSNDQN